ncbi:MAG: DUF4494 domain-containing protein [Candidatus Scalindua sp.]|nr:DUF4494 domain-containing protein [Candidatus Scalindua sp.]
MYQTQVKIQRKEGSKPANEIYLVEAVGLTDVDFKLRTEFEKLLVAVDKCDTIAFDAIFETGEGTFFKIKVVYEDIDSKEIRELYLQEAADEEQAREYFRKNVSSGEITDFNKTKIMGIIK